MTQDTFLPVRPTGTAFPGWCYQATYRIVDSSNVKEALKEIIDAKVVAWDTEFRATHAGQIVSALSFSTRPNSGWLLPIGMHHIPNLDLDIAERFVLAISKRRNVCQNARAEMRSVRSTWPEKWAHLLHITDDIQVIWYLKDPNEAKDFKESKPSGRGRSQPQGFSLGAMALKYLRLETPELDKKTFWDAGHTFAELDPEMAKLYACSDADVTLRLFLAGMDQALEDSFIYNLEMSLLEVLLDMELRGIWFDTDRLAEVEKLVRAFVQETKTTAYEKLLTKSAAVNIDSPQQLAKHIYNTLGWPLIGKKGKRGLGSVDANTMARFAESSNLQVAEAATAFKTYKKWFTLWNNFLTKLSEYQNPHTGAIHAHFLSTIVPTGRLACASPNLQQIPVRNEKAPMRQAFRARPGTLFFEADYSQIELRVFAGETKENFFYDAFLNKIDLHLKTATVIYRDEVTDKEDPRRQMGKVMNFGPIYGMKPQGLAMRTDYSVEEAEQILDDFFAAMPDAVSWIRRCHAEARQKEGVHTHFHRWRPLPWLRSRIPHEVEFGERSAVNTIVQGTAADIMKIGLVRLYRALNKPGCPFDAKMVLTVHDSVMLEVAEDTDLQAFAAFVEENLCFEVEGYPPLEIDCKVGRNWHDMTKLKTDSKTDVPEPESHDPVAKEMRLPWMTEAQEQEFLKLVAAKKIGGDFREATINGAAKSLEPGLQVHVVFIRDGKLLTEKPIRFGMQAYQELLQHLINVARKNSPISPVGSHANVQFA